MKLSKRTRKFVHQVESIPSYVEEMLPGHASSLQRFVNAAGWVTAGLGAVALGLIVGRELRLRYKFNHQTPYDFYSHAGDKMQDVEFGVGV
ncbi:MAG: hypothetical protein JSS87_01470 [Acidobacteria bacterium]|nr:hypothetical protein [Acidobacteriota bacterium]